MTCLKSQCQLITCLILISPLTLLKHYARLPEDPVWAGIQLYRLLTFPHFCPWMLGTFCHLGLSWQVYWSPLNSCPLQALFWLPTLLVLESGKQSNRRKGSEFCIHMVLSSNSGSARLFCKLLNSIEPQFFVPQKGIILTDDYKN